MKKKVDHNWSTILHGQLFTDHMVSLQDPDSRVIIKYFNKFFSKNLLKFLLQKSKITMRL